MDSLRTTEQIQLLDLVDSLRAEGLSEFTALPQLIVCGDQSSGKSSLLEAISGVPFPRKDNLCTRFATEVILRRASGSEIKVSLVCFSTDLVLRYSCNIGTGKRSVVR
jgi:ABC-type molybdenum transport system ATPase subunit/photorepair protein PhrA